MVDLADSGASVAVRRSLLSAFDAARVDADIVAQLLPPSYVFEGVRAIVGGTCTSAADLLPGPVMAALYILLAGAFFTHIYRQAVRSGLIARYSAESPG